MKGKKSQEKGSALLSVLAALSLLTIIIFLILNFSLNERRYTSVRTALDKSTWRGRGAILLLSQKLQSLELTLKGDSIQGTLPDLQTAYSIEKNPEGGVDIRVSSILPGPSQRMQRTLQLKSYSDYVFVYNGDIDITVVQNETLELSGHYLVNGTVTMNVEGKLNWSADSSRPLLECLKIRIISNSSGTITLKKGLRFNSLDASFKTWNLPDSLFEYFSILSVPLVFPDVPRIESILSHDSHIVQPDPRLLNKVKIINPALPEKQELEPAGFNNQWKVDRQDISRIYFSPPMKDNIIDQAKCLDSEGYPPGFTIKDNILEMNTSSLKLDIQPEDCMVVNQVEYGRQGSIAASIYRNVESVYLGDRRLEEGSDIEIDRSARKIIFYDPSFKSVFAHGDGSQKSFSAPLGLTTQSLVFTGTHRTTSFILEHGDIIFPFAPGDREDISWYHSIPDIYIKKGSVSESARAYIDKEVEALEIDLSDHSLSSDSILIFADPVLLKGEPRGKLTILCENDVYLNNITSGKGLEIYCQRAWTIKNEDLHLKDVLLFTEGCFILSIDGKMNNQVLTGTIILTANESSLAQRKSFPINLLKLYPTKENEKFNQIPILVSN